MYNIITLGSNCSPAAALRGLELRPFALPFDWIISNINTLNECFKTNFAHFHTGLHFNSAKKRLIDSYGFEFPHDYPLTDISDISVVGEGVIGEEEDKTIVDNWHIYYDTVRNKYARRIERFINIVHDTKPIIVLCRYSTQEVTLIQSMFRFYFNKDNVFFVNSSPEPYSDDHIINCYTERNGNWNDSAVWKEGITAAEALIQAAAAKVSQE